VEVRSIPDRWSGPDHRYFKIIGDDNGVYLLRHDAEAGEWEMTFFAQGYRGMGAHDPVTLWVCEVGDHVRRALRAGHGRIPSDRREKAAWLQV